MLTCVLYNVPSTDVSYRSMVGAVRIFRGGSKRKWVNHVSRSTWCCIHGRVSSTPHLFEYQNSLAFGQVDLPLPIPYRLAPVARADDATIPCTRCRRGYWSIYSVSLALCLVCDKKLIWTGLSVFVSSLPVVSNN